jgi:proteasome lid subunit RPN8/RPN11
MKSIIDHAAASNVEVCGFVRIENGEIKTEPAKNIAVYENDVFEIHPLEVIKQIKSGKLAAIYHTHPKTEEDESKFDRFNCENSCIPYLIYSKQTEKFNLIIPKVPHVNKEYIEILKKYYD